MIFKTDKDRNNAYRNAFSSNEGKMVLVDILDVLHFWDTVMPPSLSEVEQNALNLCAKNILARAGFWKSENIVGNMLYLKNKPPKWRGFIKTVFSRKLKGTKNG